MPVVALKLKQASAVLRVPPKDLQNLAQFKVVRPRRKAGLLVYDRNALYAARVAFYLKDLIRPSSERLSEMTLAVLTFLRSSEDASAADIKLLARTPADFRPVEIKIPFRALAREVDQRVEQLSLFRDLPRGRKRPGWKKDFLEILRETAGHLPRDLSDQDILGAVRDYRRKKTCRPEITVVAG